MNVGALYSFNQDFVHLNSRFVFRPGEGLSFASKTTPGRFTGVDGNIYSLTMRVGRRLFT